jgi:hypothetical protein
VLLYLIIIVVCIVLSTNDYKKKPCEESSNVDFCLRSNVTHVCQATDNTLCKAKCLQTFDDLTNLGCYLVYDRTDLTLAPAVSCLATADLFKSECDDTLSCPNFRADRVLTASQRLAIVIGISVFIDLLYLWGFASFGKRSIMELLQVRGCTSIRLCLFNITPLCQQLLFLIMGFLNVYLLYGYFVDAPACATALTTEGNSYLLFDHALTLVILTLFFSTVMFFLGSFCRKKCMLRGVFHAPQVYTGHRKAKLPGLCDCYALGYDPCQCEASRNGPPPRVCHELWTRPIDNQYYGVMLCRRCIGYSIDIAVCYGCCCSPLCAMSCWGWRNCRYIGP